MIVNEGFHIYIVVILSPPPHIHKLTQYMLLMSSLLAKTQAKLRGSYHLLAPCPSMRTTQEVF